MAREHPNIKASSSQKEQKFDGESEDEEEANAKVNGKEKPIQFYMAEENFDWNLSVDLRERIMQCGGKVVDERPQEGYTLVDPRTEDGELEISSRSTSTRRVVSFRFVEESIKRGSLVPTMELGLFIKGDRPVKFHLHDSLPKDEINRLRDDIMLRAGNPDAELSETQVVIHSKSFRDKLIVNRQWRQIELFETSDWLKSCITMKRFSMTGAGGRVTAPPARRPQPASQPGRKPGAPRNEYTEHDDQCLIAWMAYQFGRNLAGRQGNRPYQNLVQDANQIWWAHRHTWHSWRERYKNKRAHFDPLIIQAVNEREKNKPQEYREFKLPRFSASEEEDSDEQEDAAPVAGPSKARARPKPIKRKAQDESVIEDEQPDPKPAKQAKKGPKRVKVGTQPESEATPVIKTSASQKARQAPRLDTPSPPPRKPSPPLPSDPVSPNTSVEPMREESPITRPQEDYEGDDSQSSTQPETGILDEAMRLGQGAIERYKAELATVTGSDIESEGDDEGFTVDDPDVDVVGVTQIETSPSIKPDPDELDELDEEGSRMESSSELGQDNYVGETGQTVLDTIEDRLTALADRFGATYLRVEAYYKRAVERGDDDATAYDFAEQLLRADLRREKAVPGASPDIAQVPPTILPTSRETSSIPRLDGQKWVYPSEAQFFSAMARKNHSPHAPDMRVIVPIHNAVNERAWHELLAWEAGRGAEACGGVKLVSFKGRPGDRTPKAWFKTLLG
ncbi:unnamed protein product [Rhizoctonia solani]|uniref:holocytochrome-c synthase n=1 Tax=Rhizoctonia solani TaxID=456999 RepID=A0A8H2XHC7_9AGAM|nr:unnamed protein product [Rhizoctonia solani]